MAYKKYYESGNAAHEIEESGDFWQEQKEKTRRLQEMSADERSKERRNRALARRNQQKALVMSRGYVAFLSLSVIITCITAGYYIKLQAEVLGHLRTISSIESSVNALKFTNDADEKRLTGEIDVADIRDRAFGLGMDYASEDQVVYYKIEHPDYMTQYSEIP